MVVRSLKLFSVEKFPAIAKALLAQFLGLLLLAITVVLLAQFIEPPFADSLLLALQVVYAALFTTLFVMPRWWYLIQIVLPPSLYFALSSGVNPLLALGLFILLILVFKNAVFERVPLYLSNQTTRRALVQIAEEYHLQRFIDLGCGNGSNVRFMAEQAKIQESVGVETAPIPLLLAKLRVFGGHGTVLAQNLWKTDLASYDFVYAFLSPQPMPELWSKAVREMPANSVLVSNSFAVPDIEPSEVWQLSDRRQTKLYIYKMSEMQQSKTSC
jgi:hypothetical protein